MTDRSPQNPHPSPWAPLGRPLFRALWIATVVSNVGTWMHEVGAGWLMVTLAPSPVMVAMVQAATLVPLFLLALPAGALADIVDRRRFLIATQVWMLACATLLGVMTAAGVIGAWSLLALTFAMGCGAAMMMPAWAATVPELVPRQELAPAVALNSMGVNVARAIGPALAGVLVTMAGPAVVFFLNAASFLGIVVVLARWKRVPRAGTMPSERFFGAMRAGVRYVREAPRLQSVMVRSIAFFSFATATWRRSLGGADAVDRTAPGILSEPQTAGEVEPDRGPVLVTVEYRIAPENAAAFIAAMQALRRVRRRDGGMSWGLFEDAAEPGRYVESFLVESWVEHLRQHHRVTVDDGEVSGEARRYHLGPEPPRVRHLIATDKD
jgi:MFS family permease